MAGGLVFEVFKSHPRQAPRTPSCPSWRRAAWTAPLPTWATAPAAPGSVAQTSPPRSRRRQRALRRRTGARRRVSAPKFSGRLGCDGLVLRLEEFAFNGLSFYLPHACTLPPLQVLYESDSLLAQVLATHYGPPDKVCMCVCVRARVCACVGGCGKGARACACWPRQLATLRSH